MAVVKINIFETILTNSYTGNGVISTDNLALIKSDANAFLATIAPVDVLDIKTDFFPAGKGGLGTIFQITVIYLGA